MLYPRAGVAGSSASKERGRCGRRKGRGRRPPIKGIRIDQGRTHAEKRSKHVHSPLIGGQSGWRRGAAQRGGGAAQRGGRSGRRRGAAQRGGGEWVAAWRASPRWGGAGVS
ncbi:hypothetical protein Pa4123_40230 [Phytohabitans aurantiacus]|uniref:Uncharacterized protein n=1 Tax=Phytohabitans aurantiacus TaxID=3016789 RepID=A0ABQ5QW71_9ACTN|nr:hypothetical protein Pa4123_40230 [Phytohabitans aurantiacus]